ncbi:hypothetical protein ACH4VR_21330 [Streptomyces sp. NPDC020883]|uniref:hypothetical protein n=1 Tax=Streptomyces sp. NPDC020883 TaxID=3365099 RepID=UPI00379D870C
MSSVSSVSSESSASALPSGASVPPGAPGGPGEPSAARRRTAWAEGVDRLRAAATTEPGRLRAIGAVLALLLLVFGAATAWQVTDRSRAADDVVLRSQPLTADAASIYRSLADADTTAAGGFLAGGTESPATRARYEQDLATASRLLVKAAAQARIPGPEGRAADPAGTQIARLNTLLPRYTGLIETARTNNRQGLPLGGAYLRYANERMRTELLPAARELYDAERQRLAADVQRATARPWWALAAGTPALAALVWAQRRHHRRTNRVFNHGLLAATAASVAVLLWLVAAHVVARAGLTAADAHGARSLQVLNTARIDALRARADENLTLVARGAVLTADQKDFYEVDFQAKMGRLAGPADGPGPVGGAGELGRALVSAGDETGRGPVRDAVAALGQWRARHAAARAADDRGDYHRALAQVIGGDGSTGASFDRVDTGLERALVHEQARFRSAADRGRAAFGLLAAGAGVLAVVAAVAAVLGIGRRLSEYR